jgi:hypothetical protein
MAEQARLEGFGSERPTALIYRRHFGAYYYRVLSSRDVVRYGATNVAIYVTTSARVGVEIPTGHRAGNTFTSLERSDAMTAVKYIHYTPGRLRVNGSHFRCRGERARKAVDMLQAMRGSSASGSTFTQAASQ